MQKKDDFRRVLQKIGHKATPPRLAILAAFRKTKDPLSAHGLIRLLPRGMDQSTVYRTLKTLKEKGVITPIDLRHNHAHYELTNSADHHHLICTSCGKIEEVKHHNVEAMEHTILQNTKHFAEIKQHTLEFYGTCKACAKKNTKKT